MKPILWRYEWRKLQERFWMGIAWRLPRPLVQWAAIRLIAHASTGKYSSQVVPELGAMEALKRWDGTSEE